VRRQHRLHERGFAQQRADFAGRLLELDPLQLRGEAKVGCGTIIRRKMSAHALAQVRALADVER
jgi:hypothetical protein